MIKQAIEYIVGLKGGYDIVEQKGRTFLIDHNGKIQNEFTKDYQKPLSTSTLSSIVDYFTGDPDAIFAGDKNFIIRVGGIGIVDVMSEISGEMLRDAFLQVKADLPSDSPLTITWTWNSSIFYCKPDSWIPRTEQNCWH